MSGQQILRNIGLIAALLILVLFPTKHASGSVSVSIGEVTAKAGDTGITVDVSISGQAVSIRGVEINIGYDSNVLAFKKGDVVDGNWHQLRMGTVAGDETNTQPGQIKILLAAKRQEGIGPNTPATLARLTFDFARSARKIIYPLDYLNSSPGIRDENIDSVILSASGGRILNARIPGDTNGDGDISLVDVILALKTVGSVDTSDVSIEDISDVNGDSKIGVAEAVYILQNITGLR